MDHLIVNTSDENFEQDVLKSALPVLVDFWAPWCGPCKIIAPILEELAKEYQGKITIVKLDVDSHPKIATELNIRNIPNLKIYKDGKEVGNKVGALGKAQLISFIEESI